MVQPTTIVRNKASAPGAKYLSVYLRAFTENLRADVVQPILDRHHIESVSPDEWMDAQVQLDLLRDIEAKCSFEELVAVGMKAGEYFPLPPEIRTVEMFLDAAPEMHHSGLRDCAPEEKVTLIKLTPAHYRLTFNVPFAPFVMYGTTYAILKRLKRPEQDVVISIADHGTPFIFDIKW